MKGHKWYISMTDTFLSGWGPAKGKINKLVIECDTYDEAEIVKGNADRRPEMKYVTICVKKPYYGRNYLVNYHSKKDYENWFIKNYFKE